MQYGNMRAGMKWSITQVQYIYHPVMYNIYHHIILQICKSSVLSSPDSAHGVQGDVSDEGVTPEVTRSLVDAEYGSQTCVLIRFTILSGH